MIICFDCPNRTKDLLDRLLEEEQYKDYSEIITAALDAFYALQNAVAQQGAVVFGAPETEPARPRRAAPSPSIRPIPVPRHREPASGSLQVPQLFRRDASTPTPNSVPALPDDVWSATEEVPLDRWIFGQFNKLLPAKANCRALANMLNHSPEGVSIDDAPQRIAAEASLLGEFLRQVDERNNFGRDDTLATAFPASGRGAEKSRMRYANQFVASVNKHGQVSGLLIDLKLINHTGGRKPRLLLTQPGWTFASLPSPILDSIGAIPAEKFSEEDRDFLARHISASVPVEDFAYRTLLSLVRDGSDSPDALDAALFKLASKDRELAPAFLSSQRSGAISRMLDLGLIVRVRAGVNVSYEITNFGKAYLRSTPQS